MQRYFIEFSYFGKNYFGYQRQPNEISVQEVLENALSLKFQQEIKITGAGRTDTGVHAKKMFAHFDFERNFPENLVFQLNSLLPKDVAIKKIFEVRNDLHARFHATFRTYEYYISLEKNPFLQDFSWYLRRPNVDVECMNAACQLLLTENDFTSFAKLHADTKTNICKIYHAEWTRKGDRLKFTISADRFLRNMVRAVVGTLIEVGVGKISLAEFQEIILAKNRGRAGTSAPPQGLFLVDVGYAF